MLVTMVFFGPLFCGMVTYHRGFSKYLDRQVWWSDSITFVCCFYSLRLVSSQSMILFLMPTMLLVLTGKWRVFEIPRSAGLMEWLNIFSVLFLFSAIGHFLIYVIVPDADDVASTDRWRTSSNIVFCRRFFHMIINAITTCVTLI